MLRAQRLEDTLSRALTPNVLKIEDESNRHQVPVGAESHFKVIIVSSHFENLTRIARHRLVNSVVADEFHSGLHALSLSLHTPEEWNRSSEVLKSPPCHHKS